MSALRVGPLQTDAIPGVDLDKPDVHQLMANGRQVAADVIGADGQLSMAAVDEHGQPDQTGPTVVSDGWSSWGGGDDYRGPAETSSVDPPRRRTSGRR